VVHDEEAFSVRDSRPLNAFILTPRPSSLRSMPSASSNHDPSSFRPFPETQVNPAQNLTGKRGMERGTPRVEKHVNPALYARSRSLRQCSDCGRGTRNVFTTGNNWPITYRRCSWCLWPNEKLSVERALRSERGPVSRAWENSSPVFRNEFR